MLRRRTRRRRQLLKRLSPRIYRVDKIQIRKIRDRWKVQIVFIRVKVGTACIVWGFEELITDSVSFVQEIILMDFLYLI